MAIYDIIDIDELQIYRTLLFLWVGDFHDLPDHDIVTYRDK